MRKGLLSALVLAAMAMAMADSAGAVSICLRVSPTCSWPPLQPTFNAAVVPQRLPANKYAPVAWDLFGDVATSDDAHPPALRKAIVNIDRDVRVSAKGYRSCGAQQIDALDSEAAANVCRPALIGRGKATVELAFPEITPILLSSRLLVFNGGERGGVTKLLIHAFTPKPTFPPILTIAKITRKGTGLEAVVEIPVIANGNGSLLNLKLTLGKTYNYKGTKHGYFEAKVPGVAAQTVLKGGLAVPCTSQG